MITFIVIAYNAERTIRRCIESILSQNVEKQVFLVNNNSTDRTMEKVKDLEVKVLFERQRCRGSARNKGLASATGGFIVFVDADVEIPPGWASCALSLLERNKDAVAVGGPGFTPNDTWVSKALDLLQYGISTRTENEVYVRSLPTMDIMYRGPLIRNLRFPEYWAAEDAEFNFRLSEEGHKFLWSYQLRVTHYHVTSISQLIRKSFSYGRWYLAPYWRHKKMITKNEIIRVFYLPLLLLIFLNVLLGLLPIVALFGFLTFPIFVYLILAFTQTHFDNLLSLFQFVSVHSIKQYAQIIGIWVGLITGTWRTY